MYIIYIYMYRPLIYLIYVYIDLIYVCIILLYVYITATIKKEYIYIFGIQWDSKCIGENRRPPIPVDDISHFPRITQVITCYNYF